MWVRLSADWVMLRNATDSMCKSWKIPADGFRHLFCGTVINDDEFYNKAIETRLITTDRARLSEVCDHQSTLNNFVVTGQ
eukprot:10453658-Prorocentrum_lima.AAC.1